jgi:O-acetyl-ADP-ribose deacetylase (regulator of RNase III)
MPWCRRWMYKIIVASHEGRTPDDGANGHFARARPASGSSSFAATRTSQCLTAVSDRVAELDASERKAKEVFDAQCAALRSLISETQDAAEKEELEMTLVLADSGYEQQRRDAQDARLISTALAAFQPPVALHAAPPAAPPGARQLGAVGVRASDDDDELMGGRAGEESNGDDDELLGGWGDDDNEAALQAHFEAQLAHFNPALDGDGAAGDGGAAGRRGGRHQALANIINIEKGDIAKVRDVGAIVNAANAKLQRGSGICGAAPNGGELEAACAKIGECQPGSAVVTAGFGGLAGLRIIHAVGPDRRHRPQALQAPLLLASAYRRCLELCKENQLRSVALPCLSTGIFAGEDAGGAWGRSAAKIAVDTVVSWLRDNQQALDKIVFVVFDATTLALYEDLLRQRIAS